MCVYVCVLAYVHCMCVVYSYIPTAVLTLFKLPLISYKKTHTKLESRELPSTYKEVKILCKPFKKNVRQLMTCKWELRRKVIWVDVCTCTVRVCTYSEELDAVFKCIQGHERHLRVCMVKHFKPCTERHRRMYEAKRMTLLMAKERNEQCPHKYFEAMWYSSRENLR